MHLKLICSLSLRLVSYTGYLVYFPKLYFMLALYDKRDDFSFRIVNFPHMDSNIPTNLAYGVYISQLVRYVRICTWKLDFIHRLRRLSSRLLHQGFKSTLLRKSFTKFFKRHSAIIEKYGSTLRKLD